jgi:hypothetical protein
MARDVAAQARLRAELSPPLLELDRWEDERIAEVLADPRQAIDVEERPGLAPGVDLARPERGDPTDPPLWIVVNDEVRYVLEGEDNRLWRDVLRLLDGSRPLREVLQERDIPLEAIRKHLEEALEFGVIAFRAG